MRRDSLLLAKGLKIWYTIGINGTQKEISMANHSRLLTPEGEALLASQTEIPWMDYPRPALKRNSFLCLNGIWDFAVTESEEEIGTYSRTIRVPFPPESILSGVEEVFPEHTTLWYRRCFHLPEGFRNERVFLHFGAVDQKAQIFLNGECVGTHEGGYHAFTFDVTAYLRNENTLTVKVQDHLGRLVLPYGKQCRKRGGMWYTPVSGIWQTVWLESVANNYILSLAIKTEGNTVRIQTCWSETPSDGTVTIRTPVGDRSAPLQKGMAVVSLSDPRYWSPEDPYLYELTVDTPTDTVSSYFAFRTMTIATVDGVPRMCLNGKPYFFHGLLDQGYYSDGLFTPASPEGYRRDILAMKKLGFNTLRKHIKVEPALFYYFCDRLGMIVFQDMVNNGDYSFWRDTVLPTMGFLWKNDARIHRDSATRKAFLDHMEQTVEQLRPYPSICLWTIFNEGWGQFEGDAAYEILREIDDTRIIDTASGWFRTKKSDVESPHVYFKPVKMKPCEKPTVLSEFGGYSLPVKDHVFNTERVYGYKKFEDPATFSKALCALYRGEILPLVEKGLCGAIYTQLSDVEDEINGITTYDRKVLKVDAAEMLAIARDLQEALQ